MATPIRPPCSLMSVSLVARLQRLTSAGRSAAFRAACSCRRGSSARGCGVAGGPGSPLQPRRRRGSPVVPWTRAHRQRRVSMLQDALQRPASSGRCARRPHCAHVTDAALILTFGARAIRRAGPRPKTPVSGEGVQSGIEHHFARCRIMPLRQERAHCRTKPPQACRRTPRTRSPCRKTSSPAPRCGTPEHVVAARSPA